MLKNNKEKDDDIAYVIETLKNDIVIQKNKLRSKNEALMIMRRELDTCQLERDQFKLMAEQVQQRYQDLRKSLLSGAYKSATVNDKHSKLTTQQLNSLLHESHEANKVLQFELDEMKRKLTEYQGDIKLLREQLTRQKMGITDDNGITVRDFPLHERSALVSRIEDVTDKYKQMRRDLEQCLDEKEELVLERDVYKTKYEKMNSEINYILKGESKDMIDGDSLILENKLLKDQIASMEAERSEAVATLSKYRSSMDKKKVRTSTSSVDQVSLTTTITHELNVQSLITDRATNTSMTAKASSDLQVLSRALVDTINDKNLALSHQRRANQLLADRLTELETKLKTLEMSGLWNFVEDKVKEDISKSIEKLRIECHNVKNSVKDNEVIEETGEVLLDLVSSEAEYFEGGNEVQDSDLKSNDIPTYEILEQNLPTDECSSRPECSPYTLDTCQISSDKDDVIKVLDEDLEMVYVNIY